MEEKNQTKKVFKKIKIWLPELPELENNYVFGA
jgi:hypothetical protein